MVRTDTKLTVSAIDSFRDVSDRSWNQRGHTPSKTCKDCGRDALNQTLTNTMNRAIYLPYAGQESDRVQVVDDEIVIATHRRSEVHQLPFLV